MSEAEANAELRVLQAGGDVAWHSLTGDESLAQLGATQAGLDEKGAEARRAVAGRNILPRRRRPSLVALYLRQFRSPLVYLLLAAVAVSLGIGEWVDAFFIFVVLQVNAAIGTYQEHQAEISAEALHALVPNMAVVLRDGAPCRIEAEELVPGDIVRLTSGVLVPADLRLLKTDRVTLDQSLLTGESESVEKNASVVGEFAVALAERMNMAYAGTMVSSGRASGVVVATGIRTEVGQIVEALAGGSFVEPPLTANLERFGRLIGITTLGAIGLIAFVQLLQGVPLVAVFLVAVALAVAAIPEGLPVAITVTLAIAANRMAKRNVIVRGLPAVEGLGACSMILSDKTGTLTCNELTIKRVRLFGDDGPAEAVEIGGEGYLPQGEITVDGRDLTKQEESALMRLARSGVLCNEAHFDFKGATIHHLGDTVDVAFLVLSAKLGIDRRILESQAPQAGLIPYEPARRFAAVFVHDGPGVQHKKADVVNHEGVSAEQIIAHVKGAAEIVVPMCEGTDKDALLSAADEMAADGYRVLAVACGPIHHDIVYPPQEHDLEGLEFLGLVGLIDPVRPEVPAAVAQCRKAGIDARMVTGDHPRTALAIARELGIADSDSQVVTGMQLAEASTRDKEFSDLLDGAHVFARVEPIQKLAIVEAFQQKSEVVAVTGDGVNDAPAISAADIGVAMGLGGTDVARGAADLILVDDNFATIVSGIEEGRVAYDNVRKLIFLLVSTGLGEVVLFLLSLTVGLPPPLSAVQLLWLNLVTNGIQDIALAFEKGEPDILDRRPRPREEGLFEQRMLSQILFVGVYMGAAAFAFYFWCLESGMAESSARNLLLLLMVLFENVHALNARSETRSVGRIPLRANPFLIFAIIAAQGVHIGAMYIPGLSGVLDVNPISLENWVMVAGVALSLLLVVELFKGGRRLGRHIVISS